MFIRPYLLFPIINFNDSLFKLKYSNNAVIRKTTTVKDVADNQYKYAQQADDTCTAG